MSEYHQGACGRGEHTGVGHVGGSHDSSNLLHALQIWALVKSATGLATRKVGTDQTAVHRKDLFVNDGSNG